jgi:hypothetical protein
MRRASRFDIDRIIVTPGRVEKRAYWEFSGRTFSGSIHHYVAADANLPASGTWWFLIHVPSDLRKGGYVLVQAVDYPRIAAWTAIARTVINFAKATLPKHRGRLYAKIRLSDPLGGRKYEGWTWQNRAALPSYLRRFRLSVKNRVATTRGTDGDSLVAVLPRHDHVQMIRLFFATKAWPLYRGVGARGRASRSR